MTSRIKPLPTLKKRARFLALRQSARFQCEDFVLQGNINYCEAGLPSVGYTVTKKIGNSVERNRIRRRLRQAIASAFIEISARQDTKSGENGVTGELVVIARRGAIDESFASLVVKMKKGIDRLLAKGNKAG